MKINKIKEEIEKLGYFCYQKKDTIFSGIKGENGPIEGTFVLNNSFNINVKKSIEIEYLLGQVSVKEEFNTINELINFIKDKFPIN